MEEFIKKCHWLQNPLERLGGVQWPALESQEWRRFDLDAVTRNVWHQAAATDPINNSKIDAVKKRLTFLGRTSVCFVFVNGHYQASYSQRGSLAPTIRAENTPSVCDQKESLDKDIFARLNRVCQDNTFLFEVPDKCTPHEAIYFLFIADSSNDRPVLTFPKVEVTLGASSRTKIVCVETTTGNGPNLGLGSFKIRLGPGACLDWAVLNEKGSQSVDLWSNSAHLDRHASFESIAFSLNDSTLRRKTEVNFDGEHGYCGLNGLAILNDAAKSHEVIEVRHQRSHCVSRQNFKNILRSSSRAEYRSTVFVPSGTERSDSKQMNRNLLFSDSAKVYAQPRLAIDADDVQATHGSATGALDPGEIFYLQSRGLSAKEARFILTEGFAHEILDELENPVLRAYLQSAIRERLTKGS